MENKTGNLVISSVPTKRANEQMLLYFSKLLKKTTPEQISEKTKTLPVILIKNISEKNGRKIASDLVQMGVIANFIDPLAPKQSATKETMENNKEESNSLGNSIIYIIEKCKNRVNQLSFRS